MIQVNNVVCVTLLGLALFLGIEARECKFLSLYCLYLPFQFETNFFYFKYSRQDN